MAEAFVERAVALAQECGEERRYELERAAL